MHPTDKTPPGWLPASDWKRVQNSVPVCCVDVVPIQRNASGRIQTVGMIFRDTPHQGRRWCTVGGRMRRNESIAEAAARQIRETLGDAVRFQIAPDAQPDFVAQYFTVEKGVGLLDPRQHALGLTLVVEIGGEPVAQGEAFEFRWFAPEQVPNPEQCGFGQDQVVRACLARAS